MSETAAPDVARSAWVTLAFAVAAMLLLPAASTGTNIAFDEIALDLSSSRSLLSWIISGYSIGTAAFTLLGGQMSDRLGSKRMFLWGLVLFGLGAAASALALTVGVLIAARVLQGVGAALFLPSSLAMVLAQFPVERHPSVIGIWAAAIPVGSSLSPTFSAWILDIVSWEWLFAIQAVGAAIILVGMAGRKADTPRHGLEHRPDYLGVPIGTAAVGLLTLGIVQGPRWGWTDGWTLAAFAGAAALLPIFIWRNRTHPVPLLDNSLFAIPTFRFANIVSVGVSIAGSSVWLLWPIHLASVWGYSDFQVGLAITPTPLMAGLFSIYTGRWAEKYGYREFLVVGCVLLVLANLWFVQFYGADVNYWLRMFPGLVLYGTGMGLSFAPLNGAALADVPQHAYGRANATFNTGRSLSGAVGIAMVIAIIGDRSGTDALASFDWAFGVLGAAVLASLIATVLFWPKQPAPSS